MVSDTVVGAAIGVTGAIVGSLLTGAFNYMSTRQRINAENTRRHADYFLQEKVNALSQLHSQLERCRHLYKYNWETADELPRDEFEEKILQEFLEYETVMSRARLFLDDEQYATMLSVLQEFREANSWFFWITGESHRDPHDTDPPSHIGEFNEHEIQVAVEDARDVLRTEISEPARFFE